MPKDNPMKKTEEPVRLERRTPGLRVKHFTIELRRTTLLDDFVPCFSVMQTGPYIEAHKIIVNLLKKTTVVKGENIHYAL